MSPLVTECIRVHNALMMSDLLPGTRVISQDGNDHGGVVLGEPHPLPDHAWVQWDHIGKHDEWVGDLTVAA